MMKLGAGGGKAPATPINGATVFGGTCAACHQATGEGTFGMFPPLKGSEFANGDAGRMIRIVLKGLTGPVTVKGSQYSGQMPPWQQLSDAELAAVISYARTTWGNSGGAVTAADVAAVRSAISSRTTPWTVQDLPH